MKIDHQFHKVQWTPHCGFPDCMVAEKDHSIFPPEPEPAPRYFVGTDNSGHPYIVPWDRRKEWAAWEELPEEETRG